MKHQINLSFACEGNEQEAQEKAKQISTSVSEEWKVDELRSPEVKPFSGSTLQSGGTTGGTNS